MKRKSEYLGALGVMWEIWKSLTDEILSLGGDDEAIRLIKTDDDLRRKIAELVMAKARSVNVATKQIVSSYLVGSYEVPIDFSQNLEQMIAAGRYNLKNPNINADNFPLNGVGKRRVMIDLLHFNQIFKNGDQIVAKLEEVNDWLAQQGAKYRYRFATLPELLALGVAYPDLQRQFPIAALGSIWHRGTGYRYFACLYRGDADRSLGMYDLRGGFSASWRFAVVREPA